MSQFTSRDVLRAIYRGDTALLASYFDRGLSITDSTEKERWNLLHQATVMIGKRSDINSIKFLLSKGVDVNSVDLYGNTPLHYAVRNSDINAVQLLCACTNTIDQPNKEGITPLHQALINNPPNLELIKYLISMGANPQRQALLNFAQEIGHAEINRALGLL